MPVTRWQVVVAAWPDIVKPVLLMPLAAEYIVHIARFKASISCVNSHFIKLKAVILAGIPRTNDVPSGT
jgi:hypothetical protein